LSYVDLSSQKEKSHQNRVEHRQNEQKRKSKQRAQPFFDHFFANKLPPNDPTTIKMVSNESL
jgi:hypothetical protein